MLGVLGEQPAHGLELAVEVRAAPFGTRGVTLSVGDEVGVREGLGEAGASGSLEADFRRRERHAQAWRDATADAVDVHGQSGARVAPRALLGLVEVDERQRRRRLQVLERSPVLAQLRDAEGEVGRIAAQGEVPRVDAEGGARARAPRRSRGS